LGLGSVDATTFGNGTEDGALLYGGGAAMTPHAVIDVNGDGSDDLVLVDDSPGYHNYMVDFNLDGTSDNVAGFGAAAPTHLLVGMTDINGDGLADRVLDLDGINGGFTWHFDYSTGTAPNGVLGDGGLDGGALYGVSGMIPLLGDLNDDGLGDRVVVIDPLANPTWQGDFSQGGIFGDGNSDFFELAPFGVAGDQFLLGDVVTTIPEPAALALFLLGGLAIFGISRQPPE